MIVNNDHYINAIYHESGTYERTVANHGTRYVMAAVRILADPNDRADLAEVAALQDQLRLTTTSATPFASPGYDPKSLDAARDALVAQSTDLTRTFGRPPPQTPLGPTARGRRRRWLISPRWYSSACQLSQARSSCGVDLQPKASWRILGLSWLHSSSDLLRTGAEGRAKYYSF